MIASLTQTVRGTLWNATAVPVLVATRNATSSFTVSEIDNSHRCLSSATDSAVAHPVHSSPHPQSRIDRPQPVTSTRYDGAPIVAFATRSVESPARPSYLKSNDHVNPLISDYFTPNASLKSLLARSFSTSSKSNANDSTEAITDSSSQPSQASSAPSSKLPSSLRRPKINHDLTPLLPFRLDPFRSVTLDPATIPTDLPTFAAALTAALPVWRAEGYTGVWLTLRPDQMTMVPTALAAGFQLHHADPTALTLSAWLPAAVRPSALPVGPIAQIGIGAFVLRESDQHLLVVKERSGPARSIGWKIPTGLVSVGEEVHETAVREVREETGIETTFSSVLCVRHRHRALFGKGDLYMVCRMHVTEEEGRRALQRQVTELDDVGWIPLADMEKQPIFQLGLTQRIMKIMKANARGEYAGFEAHALPAVLRPGVEWMYHGPVDLEGTIEENK